MIFESEIKTVHAKSMSSDSDDCEWQTDDGIGVSRSCCGLSCFPEKDVIRYNEGKTHCGVGMNLCTA